MQSVATRSTKSTKEVILLCSLCYLWLPARFQYARAKITLRSDFAPHLTHLPSSSGESLGIFRIVAFVSSFICSSHSPDPHQWLQMNPPSPSRISRNLE